MNKFFTPKEEGENRYFDEDFDAEKNAYNNYVAILAGQISEGSRVLDLGCAQGRFGKILRKKGCTLIGVEIDAQAAECAEKTGNYEQIYIADMADSSSSTYEELYRKEAFDHILMADILEHVTDPTEIILLYEKLLKVGGTILVSVPNFANISVSLNLLNNHISYSDMGILDNTHLKWYTRPSFVQWIKQINDVYDDIFLDCEYIGATTDDYDEFSKGILEQYPELYCILAKNNNFKSFQILFKLTKQEAGDSCDHLHEMLKTQEPDIIELLGNALNGKAVCGGEAAVDANERMQYEKKILEEEKRTKEIYSNWEEALESNKAINEQLEEARGGWREAVSQLEAALESNRAITQQLEEAREGWSQTAKYWEDAVKANEDKDEEIFELKEKVEEREQQLKDKIRELYQRIEELESTMNPILERELVLQEENNRLREKV